MKVIKRSAVDFNISDEGEENDNEEEEQLVEVDLDDFDSPDTLQKKLQLSVTPQQVFKAKMIATKKVQGDYEDQYVHLREYCDELIRSNPGTTVKIDVEYECNPSSQIRQFKRIYICLGPLKQGFKLCGRELLGLDGCFMKGPFPGQILTAVGVDANNGIYLVAYALVEAETTNSWCWFLECLGEDLDLSYNSNFTFISDRQKGIIPALVKVYPSAEHRYCLRHIHDNMKQKWKGQKFKNLLWKCASVTTTQGFDKAMNEVLIEDKSLHDWLKEIPPRHWTRAHFRERSKCDVLLNNLCEVFNRQLIDARDKPIITCLDYIREYLMKRIVVVHKIIAKCKGPLTPTATKMLDQIKTDASHYTVIWAGTGKYQVTGPTGEQRAVFMDKRSCSCRKWDLTGMPCRHAVACIWNMAMHGSDEGIPEKWVHEAYWLDTWKKVYAHTLDPINSKDLWTPSKCPTTLIPPKHHKQVGRPKKKRKKSADEVSQLTQTMSSSGKMPRKGNTVTCDKCKQKGHNQRTCKGQRARTQ
ncbi:hypothetical protein L1987_62447 [Smallanthus sonchifolius]|uniref:Uncharacterized protein n=1 Tax=Smallanthus sonchifolius TaxID=185202 RepID=A0ACB9CAG8_9ASTR|nr:hypothetical protein L1987_62447 [Smallanthus sonchifolius]